MTSKLAHRQFYDFDEGKVNSSSNKYNAPEDPLLVDSNRNSKTNDLFNFVNKNIIGSESIFSSPFGPRKVVYCDYTASGRSLKFIEEYIIEQVLPQYGSTHTTTSVTSLQTTLFRHEAKDIIRNAVRASEHDKIFFTGSGATGAINKLLHGLMLTTSPIVFVDFSAHHSSLLPWREIGALVIRVKEALDGSLDLTHLQKLLIKYQSSDKQMIGCFTAASNITGLIADEVKITMLLHKYGALSFWDYATAAPYVDVLMNPILSNDPDGYAHKDAIFFSLHKFLGGVQTPGVLIAKNHIFRNEVPSECGGGTVFFVSRDTHRYLKDVEEREEGGTPPIVETIRGGMVMQLKMNLSSCGAIMERCTRISKRITDFVKTVPELIPLGNISANQRLPILSFMVKHVKSGKYLHYNFISAILNDVFGIQSRGGCACAGPYAQDLLGIDETLAKLFETLLIEDPSLDRSHLRRKEEHGNLEVLRPGFVRINIPYTATEDQISFIFSALREICTNGWRLLPQYILNPETGEWKHHTNLVFKHRQWLQNISYSEGSFSANLKTVPSVAPTLSDVLKESQNIFEDAARIANRMKLPDQGLLFTGEAEKLCWFIHPSEVVLYLKQESIPIINSPSLPFTPVVYPLSKEILDGRPEYIWAANDDKSAMNLDHFSLNTFHNDINDTKEAITATESCSVNIKQEVKKVNSINNNDNKKNIYCDVNPSVLQCTLREESPKLVLSNKTKWVVPTKNIFNPTVKAIQCFNMIRSSDKVLVCLSGGKDSLSLLHVLRQYQFYAKSKGIIFTLGAVTVDPQSNSYDPRPLIPYLASLGVPYYFERQGILKQAMELDELNSICSFCSRMKRGRIYSAARREGFNVLALGQHLDDLAESFLMSTFHNGRLRTMKASYTVKEGDLRVIRPFVHVREKDLRNFAESRKLPIIPENCPGCFEAPKERHRMKQLLAQQEVLFPHLFWSLKTALWPLLSIRKTGLENALFGKGLITIDYNSESDDDDEDQEIHTKKGAVE